MRCARLVIASLAGLSSPSLVGCGPAACPQLAPEHPDETPFAPVAAASPESPAPETSAPTPGPLVLDGIPEVPAALAKRVGQYLDYRSAELGDISADGKEMLVTTRFADTAQVHRLAGPGSARTQLTFQAEPIHGPRFWPGRTEIFLYRRDQGGDERDQLFVLDRKTGLETSLTQPDTKNGSPVLSRDGARLAYMSNRRNGTDFDIWVSGLDPKTARMVVEAKGHFEPVAFAGDGSRLLVLEYRSINESHLHVHDFAAGTTERLTPDGEVSYRVASFGRDADTLYVASDREGEFTELYEVSISRKTWRPLTREIPWNVADLALSGDGRTLAIEVNRGGLSGLYLLDTATRKKREVRAIGGRLIDGMRWADKVGVLALGLASATMPGDVFVLDPRTRELVRWTESELGGLDAGSLVEPTLIQFPSFDGRTIPAWYYQPRGKGPFPVVINIHGGPESQARPVFSALTQYLLAESGIAVLYPNVRGSDGYGKSYLLLDNGDKREDSVKDIGALLDWIATRPELDAKRVGVIGGSYGGYMVLASLLHYGDRLAAGIETVGISSFVTFLRNTADYRRDRRRAEYGDERDPAMLATLERISPLSRATEIRTPLFVAQGANDPRVPASEAAQIVRAVRSAGREVWFMLAHNEGHGFRKKSNRDIYTQLSVMFFEKHLRPD